MGSAPFFVDLGFEKPIVLYDGPARLHAGGRHIDGIGQLRFEWRRTPRVCWDFASDQVPHGPFNDGESEAERFEPTALTIDLRPPRGGSPWTQARGRDRRYRSSGRQPNDCAIGRTDGFAQLQAMVLNYVNQIPEDSVTLDVEADGWRITVQRAPAASAMLESLRTYGGYACTHTTCIERTDGRTFGFTDVEPTLDAIWYLTSFAAGSLVGLALPVGLDEDRHVIGYQSRTTSVDSYRGRLSWLDEFHVRDVEGLFDGWVLRAKDAFWGPVLRRAIRMCVSANRADPLDVSIVPAISCLELLAWAALQVDLGWLDLPRDGDLNLTGRLRLLLRWAGIDPAIPQQLVALSKLAAADANIPDGPAAIVWVRNRSVHPPKLSKTGKPGWPTSDQLHEAWRLALEYADLIVLRLLDHNGEYGSRLHINGRWMGTMTRVPWATG